MNGVYMWVHVLGYIFYLQFLSTLFSLWLKRAVTIWKSAHCVWHMYITTNEEFINMLEVIVNFCLKMHVNKCACDLGWVTNSTLTHQHTGISSVAWDATVILALSNVDYHTLQCYQNAKQMPSLFVLMPSQYF